MTDEATHPAFRDAAADDVYRVLVVAAEEHVTDPLKSELERRAEGRRHEVRVVSPALTETRFEQAAGDVDESWDDARGRLEGSLGELQEAGVRAEGMVGDSDPVLAIEDALADFPADEILVVAHHGDGARWMEDDIFEKARTKFGQRIVLFEGANSAGTGPDAESGPGRDREDDREVSPRNYNLPPLAARDIAGIAVALFGTIALFVLAGGSPEGRQGGFDTDTIRWFLAGAFGLINIAHVVALLLFESLGYRGFPERFFAWLSLYGTTAAIAVSALLGIV